MSEKDEAEKIRVAQAWQQHRKDCVKLAIESGVQADAIIEFAREIDEFIIAPCEREKPKEKKIDAALK